MEQKKKRRIELWAVIILIIAAAAVLLVRFHIGSKVAKETALENELRAVRTSVQLYVMINKKFPADLSLLSTTKYTLGSKAEFYLTGINVDKDGRPVDSFGNYFDYNPKTGRVQSGTREYENW